MKICIIGSTGHYGYVLDGIKEDRDVHITGIAPGSDGENMDTLYDQLAGSGFSPYRFSDYREMLDRLKPDLAVVNCYFGAHAKVLLEVLKRKIHIFVEKPVATTLEDLGQVKETYQAANKESTVSLAAMFGIRYTSWFFTAWKEVISGAIGTIRLMTAQKSYKLGVYSKNKFYQWH